MNAQEAIDRLRRHAGLAEPDMQSPPDLALMLWRAKKGDALGDLETCVSEIIQCLDILNLQLNPQVEGSGPTESMPRLLVYAISQICADCLEGALRSRDQAIKVRLLAAAWTVQCAWNAVSAGDIEDIAAHVKLERETRGL
jgi:hypothetical protein